MKITIDLNINAADLAEALRALGAALSGAAILTPQAPPAQPMPPAPPQPQPAPAAPTQPAAASLPTSAHAYTMDQLAVAATSIIDSGRRQTVVDLLAQYGVSALIALPKEHYGAFATQLRGLGAKL